MHHNGAVSIQILAVDDDDAIRTSLRLALEEEGWSVLEADSGESALLMFGRSDPDVVLIDIGLPQMDGFALCRELRRSSDVPIVMVTARVETGDIVEGLEAGADDYLTKPFTPRELAARIRALLRRAQGPPTSAGPMVVGDIEIVADEGVVRKGGEEVHLTRTEFKLLCEMAAHPGKVLSREQLLESVWGYDYFGDGRLVDVHIRRLRTKVESDSAQPQYVVTVRGMGYKLQI